MNYNYIKAKYKGSNRAYTFKCESEIVAGDAVATTDGKHLEVVGQADMAWVETYGADKIVEVKKVEVSDVKTESM